MTISPGNAIRRTLSSLFLLTGLCGAGLSGTATGQVSLIGNISDATTGPLQGGTVYHVPGSITLPIGETLTVQPGAIIKFSTGGTFFVRGTLDLGGAGVPVLCTSLEDDAAGGDTTGDGPTIGAPGQWRGFQFYDTSVGSTVDNLELRFAGQAGHNALAVSTSPVSITASNFHHCAASALNFSGLTTGSTVTNCVFTDNGDYAMTGVALADLPGYTGNTAVGNGTNAIHVTSTLLTTDLVLNAANQINGAILVGGSMTVPDGISLTLNAGVVLKPTAVGFTLFVRGPFLCNGTPEDPVVITSRFDDSIAGDTNGDGPSTGAAGEWRGILVYNTSVGSQLDNLLLRFGGQASFSALRTSTSGIELRNSLIENFAANALDFDGINPPGLVVEDNLFRNNGGHAVASVALMAIPKFLGNLANGNGLGNHLHVTNTAMDADLTIGPQHLMNSPVVVNSSFTIPDGLRLELEAGTHWKWTALGSTLYLRGALDVSGSPTNPVVMTSIQDDSIGGDTNLDGTSTLPGPGSWRGMLVYSTLAPSLIEHFEMRYGGQASFSAIVNATAGLLMRGVTVRDFQANGFNLSAIEPGSHSICAVNCGGVGFRLTGGSFQLDRTAAVGCAGAGYQADVAFAGTVINSIGWSNGGPNFAGFDSGELRYSNGDAGFAGTSGNIDVDPMFTSAPLDLCLLPGSPCIDAGDPTSAPDQDGTTADMGCQSFDQCGGRTYCTGKVNSQGCTPFISMSGSASLQPGEVFVIRANNVINQKNGLLFYGLNGSTSVPLLGGTLCVLGPLTRTSVVNSGGNPGPADCSGVLQLDFNQLIQSGSDPLLTPGTKVWAQYWYRDPGSPIPSGLSDGVEFSICD